MVGSSIRACPLRGQVDPRLLRFSAGATATVLSAALLLMEVARPLALGLLGTQVAVFGFTAFVSFQWSVWARLYARFIWPRIDEPVALEDARPARFAQFLGFLLTAPALVLLAVDLDVVGYALTGLALGLAAINAVTGLCLGCWAHRLVVRPRSV